MPDTGVQVGGEKGVEHTRKELGGFTWELVARINFKLHSVDLELPRTILSVRTESLKPGELGELKEFFIKQREIIRPEPFFGWRRSNVGKESFGPMKIKGDGSH